MPTKAPVFTKPGWKRPEFTPVQQRFVDVLRDGKPHTRKELILCLQDSEATWDNISVHMSAIRRVLRPRGLEVLCVFFKRQLGYQLVRPFNGVNCGSGSDTIL